MIKHLFKMIWNKKKQNALLISEMLISFLVLFAVFTLLVYDFQNYKKPLGFDYQNVWLVTYNNAVKTNNSDSLTLFYEILRQTVKSLPQVKEISFVNENVPFSNNTSQNGFTFKKKHIDHLNWHMTEDGYKDVLNLTIREGRWFGKQDITLKNEPVIINQSLKEQLFGNEDALGKLIGNDDDKNKMKIIGVIQDMKDKGDYTNAGIAIYH
ncbi:MAG TPA: ABC transporter permease, partial [Chitinophagaceae bacterium]|nr:ABC transporter permease [Chitinophagaceae bacterium]